MGLLIVGGVIVIVVSKYMYVVSGILSRFLAWNLPTPPQLGIA